MKSPCCLLLVLAVVLGFTPLKAQTPFDAAKAQYSADMVITAKDRPPMTNKIYSDAGKVRTEMNHMGMDMISIIRPDQKKVYSVLPAQKMVMEMPYDPSKSAMAAMNESTKGSMEKIGTETVEGVACTKYKTSSKDGPSAFFWIDDAKHLPVKMVTEDGSVTIVWKNAVAGPQAASLFEPPTDYKKMEMPAGMGGGAPGH